MSNQNKARFWQRPRQQQGGVSRRNFLAGAGLTAAGRVILEGGLLSQEGTAQSPTSPPAIGPGKAPVTLRINGTNWQVNVEPRTTLAAAKANSSTRSDVA